MPVNGISSPGGRETLGNSGDRCPCSHYSSCFPGYLIWHTRRSRCGILVSLFSLLIFVQWRGSKMPACSVVEFVQIGQSHDRGWNRGNQKRRKPAVLRRSSFVYSGLRRSRRAIECLDCENIGGSNAVPRRIVSPHNRSRIEAVLQTQRMPDLV
jgi:hypothetical protein